MGSPSILDTDSLAAPLAAVDPGAATLFRELSGRFQVLIREEPEENGHPGKKADWPGVVALARETLQNRAKDLRVASWLTAALTQVEPPQRGMTRFAGLRDGLRLLRQLAEQSWDSLLPAGPAPRARLDAISKFLDDPDAGLYAGLTFPAKVRLIPIVEGSKEGYGYLHYRHTPGDGLQVDAEDFASAVERLSAEECQTLADDVADCLAELERLKEVFGERVPDTVLGLGHLRKALEDCQRWVAELLKAKRPPEAEPSPGAAGGAASPGAGTAGVIASREQAYQRLREAAAVLGRLEPSSPVPCLVELAVQLAELPFPQLMQALAEMRLLGALVRDGDVQEKLKRNLTGS